ncbi:MAG: GtrA family protein [Paludibacteraceae bacterium]|nr:GtrA family protein [Paludibacteraceae bacterium]
MNRLAQIITKIIDFFYPPFRKIMSEQLFRYAACGGGNLVLDWVLYFLIYNFVIGHEIVQLSIINYQLSITPHIATLCIVFPITLLTGFWLQKFVTFQTPNKGEAPILQTKTQSQTPKQLSRYILIVFINLAINYFGLKLCVEILGWYPTPSKMFITLITVAVSYLGQKHFTFAKQ